MCQYFIPFHCWIRFRCVHPPHFVHPFSSWVVPTFWPLYLFESTSLNSVYQETVTLPAHCTPTPQSQPCYSVWSFVLWLKWKPGDQPNSQAGCRHWCPGLCKWWLETGSCTWEAAESALIPSPHTPPRQDPHCSLSCAPSHICCCQMGPSSACHPHILPLASFLQKAEGRLHAASLPSFKTSSTIWEACCRAGGMRMLASQRTTDACRAGGTQAQQEWDSGPFGAGPLSREEPCWARESRLDEAESAWVKVATLGSLRLKGDPLSLQGENSDINKDPWLQAITPHSWYRAELLTSLEEI